MSEGLFRDEVFLAKRGEWLGAISLQAPRLGWVFCGTGLLAVTLVVSLLVGGHYTRREQVNGTLVPSSGLLTITPVASGIVTRVPVHEGDVVHAGQPLIEISGEQVSASLGDTDAAVAVQLQIKHDRLQDDLEAQRQLIKLQSQELRSRLVLLHEQIAQMEQQIALQRQRAKSAMALYDQWVKAGITGVVSKLQVLQQHDIALENLSQLKQLNGQAFQLRQQAAQLQGQLDQLPAAMSGKRNATEEQIADIAQSLASNAAHRAILLRAPTDGTVTNVLVHPGQAAVAQQSLMTVLPADTKLVAELWVPSGAIGFIRKGSPVMLRYGAYPYQKFGVHVGRVRGVSLSSVPASVVSGVLGQNVSDARYRVEVSLDRQSVLAYGRDEPLRPGMALDADILLDRHRLIEWVLEPLAGFEESSRSQAPVDERRNNG